MKVQKFFPIVCLSTLLAHCATKNITSTIDYSNLCSNLVGDLNYIHESISRNFVGYTHSQKLRERADTQYKIEFESASSCSKNMDYVKSIRRYFAVFNDPHVVARWDKLEGVRKAVFETSTGKKAPLTAPSLQYSATGVYLVKYGNQFFVKSKDPQVKNLEDINVGDELLSCEGKTPLKILESEILPFETVSTKPAALSNLAPNILFRWDKDIGSTIGCDFKNATTSYSKTLIWNPVGETYLKEKFQPTPSKIYEIEGTPYGHWIKIKTFAGYDDETNKQLSLFTEDAKKLRNDKIVVIDVRGNTGGNSSWGEAWTKNLFGYAHDLKGKHNFVLASPDNTKHFERLYEQLKKTNGLSGNEDFWKRLLDALHKNPGKFSDIAPSKEEAEKKSRMLFKGKVYVLTDYRVFSSGEMFVEMIRTMPGVVQVGLPTNASTYYSDIRFDLTPGGIPFVHPTIAQYGGDLKRESGAPLVPKITIDYDPKREFQGQDSMRTGLEKLLLKE